MLKTDLEEAYQIHHQNRGRYGYLFCHGKRVPFIKKWVGQGKKILDLGCRDGTLTSYYLEGNEVIGVDVDRRALEMAESNLGIETVWLDINHEWPFEPNSFDVIIACELLEHVFILQPFLANIFSSLKPGGQFIGSVPNAFRLRNRLKFLFGKPFENDPTHVRMFSSDQLKSTLSDLFQDIQIIPILGKVLPFFPVSPALPYSINALFAKDLLWRAIKKIDLHE